MRAAELRVQLAKEEAGRLQNELKEYKARAQALLRAKSTEIKSAKDDARWALFWSCRPARPDLAEGGVAYT